LVSASPARTWPVPALVEMIKTRFFIVNLDVLPASGLAEGPF
jgi:hypothetical protein